MEKPNKSSFSLLAVLIVSLVHCPLAMAGSCGCMKNGHAIYWEGECTSAEMAAHGCDSQGGSSGSGGGSDAVGNAAYNLGYSIGQGIFGGSDNSQQRGEQDREAAEARRMGAEKKDADEAKAAEERRAAEEKRRQVEFDQNKKQALGEMKGGSPDEEESTGEKGIGSADSLGLKGADASEDTDGLKDASEDTAAAAPEGKKPQAKQPKKEQIIAEKDGVILTKRPASINEDRVWITNNNAYPVDVDVYMSLAANCNHSFKDATVGSGKFVCAGWVVRNSVTAPWSYTVGMNISKHRSGGVFNYAP